MDPFSFAPLLRGRILAVLALAPLAACGGTTAGGGDAGDDAAESCQTRCCAPPAENYTVTYAVCWNGPDAATDASDDADDDASAQGSVCYASCAAACQAHSPQPYGIYVDCVSETAGDAGESVAQCEALHLCGRRFDGLEEAAAGCSLGDALARMAWLEAASVHAFRRLARELRAHGAPDELVVAARACARDEARHARTMARLARARGAKVPRVEARTASVRDLESIARENAVEACVGETYGALLAMWQAEHAGDEDIRAAMREIAPDEMRHAALGWAVAAWAGARLQADARARVASARNRAVHDLLQTASIEPDAAIARATGAPRARDQARLAAAMRDAVWT
ncbi:MAG TPA: ferritin-like domain-containing protein [Polyangiaceae bacterium]|jgi:rubrerythrin